MKKALILCLIITALEFAAAAVLYPRLPELIPTHWNMYGEIDGYGGKITIFLTPALSLLMTLGLYFLPRIVPKGENIKNSGGAYPALVVILNLFMAILLVVTAMASFGLPAPVNIIIPAAIGILFLFIGNYMPKIKQNYSFGIRTPWTLDNELVWVKTHSFGRWVFVLMGLLFIAGVFFPAPYNFTIPLAGAIIGTLVVLAYSYVIYRKIVKAVK